MIRHINKEIRHAKRDGFKGIDFALDAHEEWFIVRPNIDLLQQMYPGSTYHVCTIKGDHCKHHLSINWE
jgi:hypothetical protein